VRDGADGDLRQPGDVGDGRLSGGFHRLGIVVGA
jgi:hypothetical protein